MESVRRRSFLLGSTALALACTRKPSTPSPKPPDREPPPAEPRGPLTLLVLGGTGFLGPQVVEAAQARGWKITLFNRGKTRPELFPDVEKLRGDRDGDLSALEGRDWDAVIDTSGYVPRIVRASATLLADHVQQYVFVSSISAYGDFARAGIEEDHPVAKMEDETKEDVKQFYGALKALCEAEVERALPGRTTNVRPGYIVGPGDPSDRFTYWPVRIAAGGDVIAPGNASDPVQFIDVRDLAEWMVNAIAEHHIGVYNLVGPAKPMAMGDLLQTCIDVTGSDARLTWVDAKFLVDHQAVPGADLPIWLPPEGETLGFAQMSNARAVATGLSFRTPRDTVQATLDWWKGLPEERRAHTRAGWPAAREAEVLAAWREIGKKAA